MSDVKRASLEETLDFCNKVRAAGGGNPLDALMPAVPEDPDQCLIAKNLNFNCQVTGEKIDGTEHWVMVLSNPEIRDQIASALDLETCDKKPERYMVILPPEIGQVANDFDSLNTLIYDEGSYNDQDEWVPPTQIEHGRLDLVELWPYIEASEKEALKLAGANITPDGKIIL